MMTQSFVSTIRIFTYGYVVDIIFLFIYLFIDSVVEYVPELKFQFRFLFLVRPIVLTITFSEIFPRCTVQLHVKESLR